MKKRFSGTKVIWLLALMLAAAAVCSFCLGRFSVSPRQLFGILLSRIIYIEPFWTGTMEVVVFNIRLPRILLACLVGCSLSAAGAAYQGVFQNPMASPDLLGASSGAAFGAALAILLGASSAIITLSAFLSGIVSVALVLLIGQRAPGKKVVNLILAGIMVSSIASAATSFVKLVADPSNQLPAITYWLMGSLSGAKRGELLFAAIPMAIGLIPLFAFRWRINILSLGDDEARSMGVNVNMLRTAAALCATLLTAASVSVSGMIGWVGLVMPHICRRLAGNDYRFLMPASMLGGAFFMLLIDNISRNLLSTEIPIGILTAFIGAPFFIYLILRRGGRI